jgi:hypothetical protein
VDPTHGLTDLIIAVGMRSRIGVKLTDTRTTTVKDLQTSSAVYVEEAQQGLQTRSTRALVMMNLPIQDPMEAALVAVAQN